MSTVDYEVVREEVIAELSAEAERSHGGYNLLAPGAKVCCPWGVSVGIFKGIEFNEAALARVVFEGHVVRVLPGVLVPAVQVDMELKRRLRAVCGGNGSSSSQISGVLDGCNGVCGNDGGDEGNETVVGDISGATSASVVEEVSWHV